MTIGGVPHDKREGSESTGRDTRESDDQAARGLTYLQFGFRRRDALDARMVALTVTPGSSLAGDRAAATYNPVPNQVISSLATALDHLHGLQVSVESSGGAILAMSSFTLIRSAFESAGTGLWILLPESRDERLLRSMRFTRENRRQLHVVMDELDHDDPKFEVVKARLEEQLAARPGIAGKSLATVDSVTDRLKTIAPILPKLIYPPLTLWRMASGIAHGNQSMMVAVLEQEQITPGESGSADYRVTSSYMSIAMFYHAALDMIEALIDLYDERNRGTLP